MQLQQKKRSHKQIFINKWDQFQYVNLQEEQMTANVFSHHGVYLLNAMIFGWSYSASDCDQPGILLPDKCLFRKYSRHVIYYLAGLIL